MDLLLRAIGIYLYLILKEPVLAYIYNENPKGYVASVNSINAFPKNKISNYRKFFRSANFVNEKLADRYATRSQFRVATSNVFAAVPGRQGYISSIRTQAPNRQMKNLVHNLKDINENRETESVTNANETKLSATVSSKDKLFTPNRNPSSGQQKSSKTPESLLPKRLNNHMTKLTKEDSNKIHQLIPSSSHLLEFTNKILHKTNVNERHPYSNSLSRLETLQKFLETFPRQAEYSKRDALKSRSNGIHYAHHQKKKFDVNKYNPNDWEFTKRNPLKFEVVGGVLKPHTAFDSMRRDSFNSPTLLVQDSQSSIKALTKLDSKYTRNQNHIENIFLNTF